jgi:hypothetical protein
MAKEKSNAQRIGCISCTWLTENSEKGYCRKFGISREEINRGYVLHTYENPGWGSFSTVEISRCPRLNQRAIIVRG